MRIIRYRKIFFVISTIIIIASIFFSFYFGLNFGIDFKGGTIVEIEYSGNRPDKTLVAKEIETLSIGNFSLRRTDESGFIIRSNELSNDAHLALINRLQNLGQGFTEKRYSSIGPIIGEELRSKAVIALISVLLAIIIFIAYTFRKVSDPVSSWKYGLVAILALVHDIIVPTGIYSIYSYFTGAEIDILFVTALLAILGYSINDTIVVFDRIRENLNLNRDKNIREPFEETVGKSLSQTYARSINTALTTLFVLIMLFIFGGEATKSFAFVLTIGVIAGTYSSIFLASPLLVAVAWKKKNI